jgi:Cof subfamily protein (haloacid dehalogenase superfamily)
MTERPRHPPEKISAVVSDVDGTLVTDDKVLTARARASVLELHARGIMFTVISSRPPRGLRVLLDPLKIAAPFGCFNGGIIAGPDLSVIAEHLLPSAVAQRALDMIHGHGAQSWVFAGQDWLVRDSTGPYIAREERTVGFRPTIVEDFTAALDTAAKIVGVSADPELLVQCERDVRAALADQACVLRSQTYYLDITHPLANKGAALMEIASLLGIPLSQIAVIGDGRNDIPMFEASGLSIAMGNGSPEVRRAADFVTASNREDGFAKAIERYVLQRADAAVTP